MNQGKSITKIICALTILALSMGSTPFAMHQTIQPTNAATTVSNPVIANIPIVGENLPDRQQVEPTIAIDPHNSRIIVAGAQDYRLRAVGEHRWHGYYRSTDGGETWTSSLLPGFPGDNSSEGIASPLHRSNTLSDPVLGFDRLGNVYYTGIAFNITNTGAQPGMTTFVAKYVNDGATYSFTTLIQGTLNDDKPWIAVDTSGGPHDGNVYVTFDANLTRTSYFGTVLTHSSDGGKTFSQPIYVPDDMTGELPGLTVDPSGNVYVSSDAFNPITGASLNYTQVSRVTNGGTFLARNSKVVQSACFIGLSSNLPGASFRDFTIPQITSDSNAVYLVRDDCGQGNSNILFTKSTDGGVSWTPSVRVNDFVTETNACCIPTQHFFPSIAVSGGIINIAWYDSRLNNNATSLSALDVYYAYSLDGGLSFSQNIRVTTISFNPNTVKRSDAPNYNEPFIGDYIQINATPTTAHIIWTDNRFACDTKDPTGGFGCQDQDAMTTEIDLPDFSLTTSPPLITLAQGQTGSTTVTLSSLSGFSGKVTIDVSKSSGGLSSNTPAPQSLNLSIDSKSSFLLSFSPTSATPAQSFTKIVTAISGPRIHTAKFSVTVEPLTSFPSPESIRLPFFNRLNGVYALIVAAMVSFGIVIVAGFLIFDKFKRRRTTPPPINKNSLGS